MKKHLIIFGSNGALGKGVTEVILRKGYEKVYLIESTHKKNTRMSDETISYEIPASVGMTREAGMTKVVKIQTGNLAEEGNVIKAFENIKPSKGILFFLYSTVGGFTGGKNLCDTNVEDLNTMFDSNLKTSFLIGKYFARLVKESAGGSILYTAAMTGLNPEQGKIPYGVSKSSVIYLVETLALEGAKINMTANAIVPYIIDTPANRKWMGDNYDYETVVKPADVGELVHSVFLNFRIVSGTLFRLPGRVKAGDSFNN